ncbi:MAG: gliding motility-associated C-terminal domain-containing protein [Bacteroidia bacterium]
MKRSLLLFLLFSCFGLTKAAKLYWVGGSGNFNDPAHWSFESGGIGGAKTPGATDDVTFDLRSFRSKSIVTVVGTANCRDFEVSEAMLPFILAGTSNEKLIISGSLDLKGPIDPQYEGQIRFTTSTSSVLNFGFFMPKGNIYFDGTGEWTLASNLIQQTGKGIYLEQGKININGTGIVSDELISGNKAFTLNLNAAYLLIKNKVNLGVNVSYTVVNSNIEYKTSDPSNSVSGFPSSFKIIPLPSSPTSLTASNIDSVSCNGICDGIATISWTGTGAGPPYTINWNGTPNNSFFPVNSSPFNCTGLCAGSFIVKVFDVNGNAIPGATAIVNIPGPAKIAVVFDVYTMPSCSGVCDGVISYAIVGGNHTYSITWSPPQAAIYLLENAQDTLFNICAGSNVITATDPHGCVGKDSIDMLEPSIIVPNGGNTNQLCAGVCNSKVWVAPSGGTPYTVPRPNGTGYTIVWDANAALTNDTLYNLCPGTHTFVVTDSMGCSKNGSLTIIAATAITGTQSVMSPLLCADVCSGTASVSAVAGGTPPYSFVWTGTPAAPSTVNSTATSSTASNLCAGTYTCTVTDANGCTKTFNYTQTTPALLVGSVTTVNPLCNGASTGTATGSHVGGTGPTFTFHWYNSSSPPPGAFFSSANPTVSGLAAGSYTLIVLDQNGCNDTVLFTITQPPPIVVTLTPTNPACFGQANGQVVASVVGGTPIPPGGTYTYNWSTAVNTNSATHTGQMAGPVSVTVTDNNGCTGSAAVTLVNPPDVFPVVSVTNPTCKNACNGTATSNPIGGSGGGYTYNWQCNGNTTPTISGMCAGTCSLVVTDGNGCTGDTNITFVDPNLLTLSLTATGLNCFGATTANISSVVGGGTPGYTYCWAPPACTFTTPGLAGVGAGTYVLQVTDSKGCIKKDSITITPPPQITITTTPVDPSCNGGCNGTITTVISGGTPNPGPSYGIQWSPSSSPTNQNQAGLCAGTYALTVTDANNCTQSTSVTLNDPIAVSVTTSTTAASCNGGCNGTATATGAGGNGTYTYSWATAPVQNTQTASGLCAGTYIVTATDGLGCTGTGSATVTEPPPLSVLVINVTSSCSICNGTADITVSGGTGAVTYTLDGVNIGATTSLTSLCIGNHTVIATDANGCTATTVFNVPPQVTLTITTSTLLLTCNGACNAIATANVNGATGSVTYAWASQAPTNPLTQNSQTATNLCAGTHTITVTDQIGCTSIDSVTFSDPPVLTASMVSTTVVCAGNCTGSSTVTPAGGTPPYTVSWSDGQSGNTASALCTGSYTATVTDGNGCQITKIVNITNAPLLTAAVTTSAATCNSSDGSITATPGGGSGSYTISWANPPGGATSTISALAAGVYTVTITDQVTGCDTTIQIGLSNITGPITEQFGVVNNLCPGQCLGTATVDTAGAGAGPFTVTWPGGAPTGPPPLASNALCANTYPVQVSDANGCITIENVTITSPSAFSPHQVITQISCNGGNNGSIVFAPTGGTSPFTYTIDGIADDSSMTGLTAGPHTVIVTDANGCANTYNFILTQPPALTAIESHNNIMCTGPSTGSATVTPGGGSPAYSYSWFDGTSVISVLPSVAGLAQGSYTITVTDASGCTAQDTAVIGQNPALISGFVKADNLCSTGCTGTASFSPSGGSGTYTFQWSTGSVASSVSGLCQGNYQGIVFDNNGCSDTVQFSIATPAALTASEVHTNPSCNGYSDGTVTVTPGGGTPGYTYSWSPNINNSATSINLNANVYTATVADANGCTISITATLVDPPILLGNITATQPTCFGSCDGFLTSAPTGGTPGYTYSWSPVPGSNPVLNNLCIGNYVLVVTDSKGCKDTSAITLTQPPQVGLSASTSPAACGVVPCDGGITINSIVGTSVVWLSPAAVAGFTGLALNNLCAGIYDIEITDANSCKDTVQVGVSNSNGPLVNVDSTDVTCPAACNGTATVVSVSGNAPFTYGWGAPITDTDSIAASLCVGTYLSTVTDAIGCITITSVDIHEPGALDDHEVIVDATCNGINDGTITLAPTGGTAPYTYLWSTGAVTSFINNAGPGAYSVTITDANLCTYIFNYNVNANTQMLYQLTVTNNTCFGVCAGTAALNNLNGGTAPYVVVWSDPASQTSTTASNLCAGNYTVTVTDNAGCLLVVDTAITEPSQILSNPTVTDPNCGQCDGQISLAPSGGAGPYTYVWGTGPASLSSSITNVCAGVYNVQITDAANCVNTYFVPVSSLNSATVTATPVSPTCSNSCNGSISTSVAGGIAPITYFWTIDGQTTSSIVGQCAGTYFVQAQDSAGCIGTTQVTISAPSAITANPLITPPTFCGACDGQIVIQPSGGTPNYSFAWSPGGASNDTVTALCAGVYSVIITDAVGCSDTVNVALNSSGGPTLNASATNVICNSQCNGTATVVPSGGVAPYNTINWTSGGIAVGSGSNINNLCPGQYAVSVTDAAGCTSSTFTNVGSVSPLVLSIATVNEPSCGQCNGTIGVVVSGGALAYNYLWGSGSANDTLSNVCAGVYQLQVTDANTCLSSFSIPVSNNSPLAITATATGQSCASVCDGAVSTSVIGASGPVVYSWPPGAQTTPSLNGLCTGVYTVQVQDSLNCIATAQATVSPVNPVIMNTITVPPSACGASDGMIVIQPSGGSGGFTFNWLAPVVSVNDTVSGLGAGTYSVVVTDGSGCADTVIVPFNNTNGPNLTANTVDATCGGLCNGSATANPTGGSTPYASIDWTSGGVALGSGLTQSNLCAGQYIVTVTDAAGCIKTLAVTVAEPALLTVSAPIITSLKCNADCNGSITAVPFGGQAPYTYAWTPAGPSGNTAANLCSGNYSVVITDVNGCTTSEADTLVAPPVLDITGIVTNSVCNTTPNAAIDATPGGGTPGYTFQWSGGSAAATEDLSNILIGSYSITVTDLNGCKDSANFNVASTDTVIANAGNDTSFCQNGAIQISALNSFTSSGTLTYAWDTVPGVPTVGPPTFSANPASGLTQYELIVTNTNGCTDVDTISVTSNPLPTADAGIDAEIYTGQNTVIGGNPAGAGGTSPLVFHWSGLDTTGLSSTFTPNPVASPTLTLDYILIVSDSNSCTATDTVKITVLPEIKIPNGISPNGDGKNDTWMIGLSRFPDNEVEIYNRWGDLLYQKQNYDDTWDGTYKGKPLPIGTYYYVVKLNDPKYPDHYTGPITIFK